MSNLTNEPSNKPKRKPTNNPMIYDLSSNEIIQQFEPKGFPLNTSADTSQPTVAKTSEGANTSATIKLYTEREVGTWQLLPELDVEPGDFSSDTSIVVSQSSVAKTSEGDNMASLWDSG
jgi:hypothetical protein